MATRTTRSGKGKKGMPEPVPGQEMPAGVIESEPSGEETSAAGKATMADTMPLPKTEGIPEAAGEMPIGTMQETPAPDAAMATASMAEPAGNISAMPSGSMSGGKSDAGRFGPDNLPPGTVPPAEFEPGIVEVEFREGVQPRIMQVAAGARSAISSPAGVSLAGLNQILETYGVERAEPSFQTSEEEATAAQTTALQRGIALPNLCSFVMFYFPADADIQQIAREMSQLPEVERAVAVPKAIPPESPLNEPLVGTTDQVVLNSATGLENQWYIFRCRANGAWSMASGNGVVIADIDWGYRTSHQDLVSRLDMSHAYNAYDGGTNVTTGSWVSHGTGVMGIAGGADNDLGMAGFAYGATLWPVQADTGPGTPLGGNSWARAIDWVRTTDSGGRRKVINLEVQTGSYGNYEMVPSVNAAIRTAIAHGVVVCVAAGNGNRDAGIDDSGNAIPETGSILVGATQYHATQNQRASFSNFGSRVVVCAPGDGSHDLTCSNSSDSAYRNGFGGTSGATPKVAGTVALMLDLNPDLSHAEIRDILNRTGTAVVTDTGKPVGTFLNAEAAVRQARRSVDGRMEVFVRGSDKALWHKWQTAPNNGWSGWSSLGGWIDGPVTARNADGRLEVFVIGSDHALWHRWQTAPNNGWSGWASMGGWIDRLAVSQNADGRLEVFARGSDKALWHRWQTAPNNGWSGWASLGGWVDSPVIGRNADGRLEIFVIGSDHALWHKWQTAPNNGWSGWASLGGWIDHLTLNQNADGRLEVFARGSDKALWHKWQTAPNNGWSGWASMGGWVDAPVAGRNADGRLEVFVIGSDHALWHKWQTAPNNGWSGWASLGGWIDLLGVSHNADGRLEVFARGSDSALWHKWQTAPNNGWSGWASLGGWIDQLAIGLNALG